MVTKVISSLFWVSCWEVQQYRKSSGQTAGTRGISQRTIQLSYITRCFRGANCVESVITQFQFAYTYYLPKTVNLIAKNLALLKIRRYTAFWNTGSTERTYDICSFAFHEIIIVLLKYTKTNCPVTSDIFTSIACWNVPAQLRNPNRNDATCTAHGANLRLFCPDLCRWALPPKAAFGFECGKYWCVA